MRNTRYNDDNVYSEVVEVKFPQNLMGTQDDKNESTDKFENLSDLLNDLNRQVSEVDGSVSNLVNFKEQLDVERKSLVEDKLAFEDSRFAFEQQMKKEYQKLNDLKIDFEQEKTKIFNDIQTAREMLEKNKRTFEKYRQEQMALIEQNKKTLTKNYEQFEKIVTTFNEKIDNFENQN